MGIICDVGRLSTTTYDYPMHEHELWEFVYFTYGNGYTIIEGEKVPFNKNEYIIIPPGTMHADISKRGYNNIFFTFDNGIHTKKTYLKYEDTENEVILQLLQQMYDVYMKQPGNWQCILDSLFEVILQYMQSTEFNSKTDDIGKIKDDIIANIYNVDYRLEDTFEKYYMNPNYLRAMFTQKMNETPLQFLTRKRVEYAERLLRTAHLTNYTIKHIAYLCGFKDQYYFSRVFKKQTGLSPSQWMKNSEKAEE